MNYQFSALFSFVLSDIHLIFGTLLCHTNIQIKVEFGFDSLIFHEVMALGLRKISQIISFLHCFRSCFQYLFDIWYIAYPYQDTDQVSVWFWFIDFSWSYGIGLKKNITNYQFSVLFLFMLSDIHLIFGILLCHTKIQIRFEFGVDPLIFHEILALGLRKISQIISFFALFSFVLSISIWYLVHCLSISKYRSSLSLALIHWFFTKLWHWT
jgi:hypothetical protein